MPQHFYITIRNGTNEGDPGQIQEGWYVVDNGIVRLTDQDGRFRRGDAERKLPADGNALGIAKDLLRITSKRTGFNRPLRAPDLGIV